MLLKLSHILLRISPCILKIGDGGREDSVYSPVFIFKVIFVNNPFLSNYETNNEARCNSCSYGDMSNVYKQDKT